MLLSGSIAFAQNDPTVMTINGKPVTRSEFEYSYNKNNSIPFDAFLSLSMLFYPFLSLSGSPFSSF